MPETNKNPFIYVEIHDGTFSFDTNLNKQDTVFWLEALKHALFAETVKGG